MFGKAIGKVSAVILMVSALACAQPKYIRSENLESTNPPGQQNSKVDQTLGFQKNTAYLSWAWEKRATSSEPGSIVFKIYRPNLFDQTLVPVDLPCEISVLLWMPGMGHGSSPTAVERLDIGTYRASRVFFVMPGEWDIHFQSKNGNMILDEIVVPFVF